MQKTRIELHARREGDLATLGALRAALEGAGETVALTCARELPLSRGESAGPIACDVRVVVAAGGPMPHEGAGRLVAVVDGVGAVDATAEDLREVEAWLVPGPWDARRLQREARGQVLECGIGRLDAARAELAAVRRVARATLGIPDSARLVVCALLDASRIPAEPQAIGRLAASGNAVGLHPLGRPASAIERERAARIAGAVLLEDLGRDALLAAADAVVSDDVGLLCEAAWLGRRALLLGRHARGEPAELGSELPDPDRIAELGALERALRAGEGPPGGAATWLRCYLSMEVPAAARMAEAVLGQLAPRGSAPSELQLFAEVEAQLAFGDAASALARIESHLAAKPSAAGYRTLASVQRRAQRLEPALQSAHLAEQLARLELARVQCERGRVLVDAGEPEAARGVFEEARRCDAGLAEAWVGLGSLDLHRGDAEAAERHFREALEREKSPRAWSGLGLALVSRGRARDSIALFETALDLDPECLPAVYGLVRAAFDTGELEPAERRVSAFVELHPANLDLAFTLAGLRQQLGDLEGARDMIERVELFDPAYPGAAELGAKLRGRS